MRLPRPSLAAWKTGMDPVSDRLAKVVSTCCAVVGGVGALACSVSMTLAAVGVVGAAAVSGSMAGMSGHTIQPGSTSPVSSPVRFLIQVGPPLLIFSLAAISVALGIRRRVAVIPALVAGVVMYAGMYLQSRVLVMYAAIAFGLIAWISLYIWTERGQPTQPAA